MKEDRFIHDKLNIKDMEYTQVNTYGKQKQFKGRNNLEVGDIDKTKPKQLKQNRITNIPDYKTDCHDIDIPKARRDRGQFLVLGLNSSKQDAKTLCKRAIWIYATYRAFHTCRQDPGHNLDCIELMKQFARIGVQGHSKATSTLDAIWTSRS